MRIFAIKDDTLSQKSVLGYLIYYENAKAFYIELPDDADPWETPLLLSSFVKRGERSVSSYWSRLWVQQRIIPRDRQNIGQVLKENGLTEYDEFQMLMLTMGRCAQDECYLEEINTTKKICDAAKHAEEHVECQPYVAQEKRFHAVEVQPDGYGVMWSDRAMISDRELYEKSENIPLSLEDFIGFVQHRIVNANEACQLLGCSRQNIDDLMKRDKLHPIRKDAKYKLFLKSEIMQRRKQQ